MAKSFENRGRLQSRPGKGPRLNSDVTGFRRMGLDAKRDGALYVPTTFRPRGPNPLIVTLHGAGGNAEQAIRSLKDLADHTGCVLLAPESQGPTWDLILKDYDQDVYWLDEALSDLFSLYQVDPKYIALTGFSDGASYALSLGMTNGDLFTHIIAFSPGFKAPAEIRDSPPIFISHGIHDEVLPIDRCSRNIVPKLKERNLKVTYREFDGGHEIPSDIAKEAFSWFLGDAIKSEISESRMPTKQG